MSDIVKTLENDLPNFEESKVEELKVEELKVEESKVEESKVEESKVEESTVEELKGKKCSNTFLQALRNLCSFYH